MKYREFLEMARDNKGCCGTESLNERFARYINYKPEIKPAKKKAEKITEAPAENNDKEESKQKWL
jgi:hypothetical protein